MVTISIYLEDRDKFCLAILFLVPSTKPGPWKVLNKYLSEWINDQIIGIQGYLWGIWASPLIESKELWNFTEKW